MGNKTDTGLGVLRAQLLSQIKYAIYTMPPPLVYPLVKRWMLPAVMDSTRAQLLSSANNITNEINRDIARKQKEQRNAKVT